MELGYEQKCRIVYKKCLINNLMMHLNIEINNTFRRGNTVVSKITLILEILSDGKWHGIEELQGRMGLNERKVQEIAKFLNEFDLAKIDDANRKVKINRNFQKFLAQTVT